MKTLIEEIKRAITLEEKGYEFYAKTAAKTNNPLVGSTFSSLADREMVHIKRIKELYQELSGEKKLASDWLKGVEVAPSKKELLKPILNKLKKDLNKKFKTADDITNAYGIGQALEQGSFMLYEKIAKESNDEKIKKFYTALAQEEKEHYDILTESLQYLNNPAEWFKQQEHWILEG